MGINWKELFKKENTVFHCETKEIAIQLLNIAHEHGYKWSTNKEYDKINDWDTYKSETCYKINTATYADKNWYSAFRHNIINVKDLFEGERKPFKLKRK